MTILIAHAPLEDGDTFKVYYNPNTYTVFAGVEVAMLLTEGACDFDTMIDLDISDSDDLISDLADSARYMYGECARTLSMKSLRIADYEGNINVQ